MTSDCTPSRDGKGDKFNGACQVRPYLQPPGSPAANLPSEPAKDDPLEGSRAHVACSANPYAPPPPALLLMTKALPPLTAPPPAWLLRPCAFPQPDWATPVPNTSRWASWVPAA